MYTVLLADVCLILRADTRCAQTSEVNLNINIQDIDCSLGTRTDKNGYLTASHIALSVKFGGLVVRMRKPSLDATSSLLLPIFCHMSSSASSQLILPNLSQTCCKSALYQLVDVLSCSAWFAADYAAITPDTRTWSCTHRLVGFAALVEWPMVQSASQYFPQNASTYKHMTNRFHEESTIRGGYAEAC